MYRAVVTVTAGCGHDTEGKAKGNNDLGELHNDRFGDKVEEVFVIETDSCVFLVGPVLENSLLCQKSVPPYMLLQGPPRTQKHPAYLCSYRIPNQCGKHFVDSHAS